MQLRNIVFIVLTNHPDPQYHRVCMESGASYFLDKTIDFDKVRDLISGLGRAAMIADDCRE